MRLLAIQFFVTLRLFCLISAFFVPFVAVAEDNATSDGLFFPLKPLSVQYRDDSCGIRNVAIEIVLVYNPANNNSTRIARFEPKISAYIFEDFQTMYSSREEEPSLAILKVAAEKRIHEILGKSIVYEVLIANIVYI